MRLKEEQADLVQLENNMEIISIYNKFKECGVVTTDTRTLKGGEMFFALRGENFDGNEYALKALELGARYAVVNRSAAVADVEDPRLIKVEDTLKTLQELARWHRSMTFVDGKPLTVIALTGTNGKTTTNNTLNQIKTDIGRMVDDIAAHRRKAHRHRLLRTADTVRLRNADDRFDERIREWRRVDDAQFILDRLQFFHLRDVRSDVNPDQRLADQNVEDRHDRHQHKEPEKHRRRLCTKRLRKHQRKYQQTRIPNRRLRKLDQWFSIIVIHVFSFLLL